MWFYKEDETKSVFTGADQIENDDLKVSDTIVLLYMKGIDLIKEMYETEQLPQLFPRFLNACPVYKITLPNHKSCCFLDGGRGAPMAADTIEICHALGAKNVLSVGMIGCFDKDLQIGDIVIPNKAYVEEGTSLHYYESIEYSEPDAKLFSQLTDAIPNHTIASIVSCDAVYRQTFYKEALWRKKGCVGVDMETSALLSIGKYLGLSAASVLMVSDKHPLHENDVPWIWDMNSDRRKQLLKQVIDFALTL